MALSSVRAVLAEPVAMFEFGVVVEVFGIDRTDDGVPPFDFAVCSARPGVPLGTIDTGGLTLTTDTGLDALPGSDLVVVGPGGGDGYQPEVLDALRAAYASGSTLLSLCSGAFALAAAGLLDGRRCTTHWRYAEELRRAYPNVEVDSRVLFVDEGRIVTSAGTAAGIDACLHLVRRELGAAVATRIARRMVVPPQRDGGQQQFVETPIPESRAESLAPVLDWVVAHLGAPHSGASMAHRALMSPRTFARRFVAETGTTPHRWLVAQRLLAARRLLEESDLGVEQISERVGFGSPVVLREHFRREVGLSPAEYRRRFVPPAA